MRALAWLLLVVLVAACGPRTMQARLKDAERLADKASVELDKAEAAATALEPKKMESALDDAKELLGEKDIELYPEAQMHLDRYKELVARVPQVKAAREKRDLDVRLNKARDKIVPRVQALLEAQDGLTPTTPTKAQCDAVDDKAKALKDAVDDDQDLFGKDADFATWAKSQRNKVDKALEASSRARRGLAFLEGPAVSQREALTAARDASTKKEAAEREKLLDLARTKLGVCVKDAHGFEQDKATSAVAFVVDGKPTTPAQLASACEKELKTVEADWAKASKAAKEQAAKDKAAADKAAKEAEKKAAAEKAAKDKADKAAAAKAAKEKAAKDKAAAEAEKKAAKEKAAKDAADKKAAAEAEKKAAKEKAAKEAAEKKAAAKKKK